eukprot:2361821-Pleurochrysis_carterae.AAC.3
MSGILQLREASRPFCSMPLAAGAHAHAHARARARSRSRCRRTSDRVVPCRRTVMPVVAFA